MKKLILFALPLLIVYSSCRKSNSDSPVKALVFGTYGGFCIDCTNVYRLDNVQLQKGPSTNISDFKTYSFSSTATLDATKYNAIKHLLMEIPVELLSGANNNKVYGCPGCHDQSSFYVEVDEGDHQYRYAIDGDNTSDQSPAIITFKQKVADALSQL